MTSPRKFRVTHIASGDLWAGAEVQLYTLCKALSKLNKGSVNVILLNHGSLEQKLKEIEIPVVVLDEAKLNGLQIGWRIFKQLRHQQPDIIHTHRIKENILGGLAAKMACIPSLRTVHGAPEHRPGWLRPHKHLFYLLDWLTGLYLQSGIIAVSDELKILLQRRFPKDKIKVIENGVDIESLRPYMRDIPAQEPVPPSPPTTFKVGLVGRLVPVKRADIFIQIAGLLKKTRPDLNIKYHIYGEGPLLSDLNQLCETQGVEQIIKFEGHCDDIYQQIASLDALLITSDHEGLPMTLLEAMVLGTPIVAHSIGGITKVCDNGKGCMLSKNNTVQDLSEKLLQSLSDPITCFSKKKYAQTYVQNNYSATSNAAKYQGLYRRLLV